MKTKIFKMGLPMLAFMFAIVASFAFKPMPNEAVTDYFGAKQISHDACSITTVKCTTINTGVPCTDSGVNLYRMLSATSCPSQLWKP